MTRAQRAAVYARRRQVARPKIVSGARFSSGRAIYCGWDGDRRFVVGPSGRKYVEGYYPDDPRLSASIAAATRAP